MNPPIIDEKFEALEKDLTKQVEMMPEDASSIADAQSKACS